VALTVDQLIEVWRKLFPDSYTVPLEQQANGRGMTVIGPLASIFARCSDAVELSTQAMHLLDHSEKLAPEAQGRAFASGTVTITRAAPAFGDIELYEGDELFVSIHTADNETVFEIKLELTADLILTSGSKGPFSASVLASSSGYRGNITDSQGRSVAFQDQITKTYSAATTSILTGNQIVNSGVGDLFDASQVGAFIRWTSGANRDAGPRRITAFTDENTITVDGASLAAGTNNAFEIIDLNELGLSAELDGDLSGGIYAWLDQIGGERGLGRYFSEDDDAYRDRITKVPDLVSPAAVYRAISRILTPLNIPFLFIESRNPNDMQGWAWGQHAWDDPSGTVLPASGQRVWQGQGFQYRGFYVVVERQAYGDFGAPFDQHPSGQHPHAAWGEMFYDGYPVEFWSDLRALIDEVEKTRMNGVPWLLVLVDSI